MTGGPPGGPPGPPAIDVDEQRAEDFASLFRLDGRRVILVGGYGGIGEVTSRLFADYGADVVIAGRSEEKARSLADELSGNGTRTLDFCVDLADRERAGARRRLRGRARRPRRAREPRGHRPRGARRGARGRRVAQRRRREPLRRLSLSQAVGRR